MTAKNLVTTCATLLVCVNLISSTSHASLYPAEFIVGESNTNHEADREQFWHLDKINAPIFWETSKGNSAVKVLVCDTGIESNHPDLRGNISLPGHNFVDDSTNTEPTGNGHGTRMAGIIGARGSYSGTGAKGIAWDVQIVPGKISNAANGEAIHTNTAKCIRWAADNGIRIVNLSYSGTFDEPEVQEATEYLYNHNGVLIVSAGNTSERKPFLDNPHAVVVSATNSLDWKPPWANSGDYVDITAPGASIFTTDMGGKYVTGIGCSLATAVVSGSAALLLSIRPDLTAQQLIDTLLNSVDDLGKAGRDPAFGTGRLNLQKSLELLIHK